MATQVGDIIRDPNGPPRVVLEVWQAGEYVSRLSASVISYRLGGAAERCALWGTTKGTTPEEKA